MKDGLIYRDTASPKDAQMHTDYGDVVTVDNELLGFPLPLLDEFESGLRPRSKSVGASVDSRVGDLGQLVQLRVVVNRKEPSVDVSPAQGGVAVTKQSLRFLRHAPQYRVTGSEKCRRRDLNPRHADYDSAALTS